MSPRQWGTRGAYSVLDQGFLSGANFALSLCYARWLTPDEYGVFSISLAVFLFLAGFHNAILLEPMSVLGPARKHGEPESYFTSLLLMHAGLTLPLAILAVMAGAFLRLTKESLGKGLEAVGLVLPLILLYWLLRRACYVNGDSRRAAQSGFCYAGCLLAMTFLCRGSASPSIGVISMGAAAAVASIVAFRPQDLTWRWQGVRGIAEEHWQYGKWAVGVSLLYWLTGSFFVPILGFFGGLSSAATLRAAENLLSPLSQTIAALSLLTLPWLSGQVARGGGGRLQALTVRTSVAGLVLSGCYVALILGAGPFLISRVYAGHSYDGAIALLPILCLASVLRSTSDLGVGLSLRAASRPDATFWAAAAAAVCSVTIGVGLVRAYGPMGAAWAALLATGTQAAILAWRFIKAPVPEPRHNRTVAHSTAQMGEAV